MSMSLPLRGGGARRYLNLTKNHLDTYKVKTVQKMTPKQAKTENQIRITALERSVIYNITVTLKSVQQAPKTGNI